MTTANGRTSEHPVDRLFLERWSPRAFTGESISDADLATIFEAARWAPSAYNSQPWRFAYAKRDSPYWDKFLSILIESNQVWAKNAAVLIYVVSASTLLPPGADKAIPSHSHSFDAGCAWGYLALQARLLGWDAHGMIGFDMDRAFAELDVHEGNRVEAAIVVGRRSDPSILPEKLAAREKPNGREPLASRFFEGGFRVD